MAGILDSLERLRGYAGRTKRAIKGREGYELRPSRANPRVKRWMREVNPQGRASLSPDSPDLSSVLAARSWSKLAHEPAFIERFRPTLKGDLEVLRRAADDPMMGWFESSYDWRDPDPPDKPPAESALFGQVHWKDGAALSEIAVAHPDQYAARVLGTALPILSMMSDPAASRISVYRPLDSNGVRVEMTLFSEGVQLLKHEREFDPEEGTMYNSYFDLAPGLQGYGLGAAAYAAQFALGKWAGLGTVNMIANLEMGGYAWPLLGFDFSNRHDKQAIRWRLLNLIEDEKDEERLSAEDAVELIRQAEELDHAWEFARFTVPQEMGERGSYLDWRQLGKRAMRGSNYAAYRDLYDLASEQVAYETIKDRLAKLRRY